MAYEQKPGDFTLNPTKEKRHENSPDYYGYGLDCEGVEVKFSCWIKRGPKGEFFACRQEQKADSRPIARNPYYTPSQSETDKQAAEYRAKKDGYAPQPADDDIYF